MIHDRSGPILAPGEAREYWPLVYSHVPETGFTEGFDLTSIPAVVSEIEVAFETDRPVATSFVSLPGDFEEGDVIIVAAVRSAQVPAGLAVATVRLDEALSERAEKLLGSDFDVELSEVNSDSLIAPNDDSPGTWASTVAFGGRRLLLIVAEDGAEASWGRNEVALVVSLLIAGAASWFAYSASRRRAVGLELAALQVSLREKDRFLASVSHELRTPLTAVVGILDILAADDVDLGPEERESLVSDARESAFDLERLVEDHLTAARLSAGALTVVSEIVDLDELMRSVVASLNLPSNLQVEVDRLGLCQGDRLRIRQIARNILRNGARYAVATIEVRLVQSRERVRIEFRNDGEAVSPAIVSRLFEPFVGLGQSGQPESIGLGLAISRDLARRMGGDLEYLLVEDQVCFALTLWPAQIDGLPESARPSVTTLRA
jgi:signal transduction histidine kinase